MLRGPKKFPVLSDSSSGDEDVRLLRVNTRNTRSQVLSRATRIENVNSGSSSALTTRKRRNKLPVNTSNNSSSSEFENTLQKTKRGSLRPLSDYDSGENSGEGSSGMSTRSTSSGRVRQEDKTGNSHYTGESSDSSSDFNVTRSGRKRHFSIVSSSDSSDSGIPVTFKRSKRMRLESTSSDSSIEHSNNRLSTVTNRPFRTNTSRRPTVTATVTSNAVRQENVAGRQMPPSNGNNNNRPNNNRRRNNNSQSATIGVQRSVNTRSAGNNRPAVGNRQSNLRSTNNFTVRENPNNYSLTQSQRTDNNSRSRSNNSTSRTINPRPSRATRSQNNSITSQNRQVRPTLRMNRWNITDTNARTRTQNSLLASDFFDTSSIDSDYFISPVVFRNNRHPLSSSSSSSPSSTSSDLTSSSDEIIPVLNLNRRNRRPRVIIESDEENNTNNVQLYESGPEERNRNSVSSGNVSRPLADVEKKSNKKDKEHSSDSEGESDKCPICLAGFKIQEIGTPKICDHTFCLVCLQEWAKNNNTCPVDRKLFNSIVVRAKVQGQPIREITVETPRPPEEFTEPLGFWSTVAFHLGFSSADDDSSVYSVFSEGDGPEETCCVCRLSNRSDFMIVCDYCYNVFHLDCVDPPLQYVPADDWNCPQCLAVEMESYSSDSSSSYSDYVV